MLCRSLMLGLWLFSAASVHAERVPLDRVVAIVDDGVILQSELDKRIHQVGRQMARRGTTPPPSDVLEPQVLERMILEAVELQLADKTGIRVDDTTVSDTLANIARQNSLSVEAFLAAIREEEGMDTRTFRDQIRREMTINQLRQRRVGNRVKITDQDIDAFLQSDLGKTNLAPDFRLGHILIAVSDNANPDERLRARQRADDVYAQLKAGADFAATAAAWSNDERALEGGDLGWRKAGQLPTLFAEAVIDMGKGDISEPISSPSGYHVIKVLDLRGGTDHHVEQTQVRHILIKPNEIRSAEDAHTLIGDIQRRITTGNESFESLAKTYSDDPGSATQGGDLGWTNPGMMVKEFEAVMNASKEKTVSAPFRTQFGWHILEVTGRRNQDMSTEFKRNRAKQMLFKRKYDEDLTTWLREIRQDAFVEIKS